MAYIIYSETEFESDYGMVHKGDEINIIQGEKEDEQEIREWLIQQYVMDGIDVSYRLSGTSNRKRITYKKVIGC